jgi:hypothetical protein
MDKNTEITIKLLHERRNTNARRKVEGKSGTTYVFLWSTEHKAYTYTTAKQEEVDDLFYGQGRVMGSYFAPVFTVPEPKKPLSGEITLALMQRNLALPDFGTEVDAELVALTVLDAFDKGRTAASGANISDAPPTPTSKEAASAPTIGTEQPKPAAPVKPAKPAKPAPATTSATR